MFSNPLAIYCKLIKGQLHVHHLEKGPKASRPTLTFRRQYFRGTFWGITFVRNAYAYMLLGLYAWCAQKDLYFLDANTLTLFALIILWFNFAYIT